ncbi:MAG: UvrD-helicase domain-containing protein, partial [Clostridia bacterium]|nr:UvrD-helicase domain-containing protein [Clostridia bacterium]
MERKWTERQLEAINKRGDLLVSAAAGAGKTAVLTERIARLISEGTGVDELLVV